MNKKSLKKHSHHCFLSFCFKILQRYLILITNSQIISGSEHIFLYLSVICIFLRISLGLHLIPKVSYKNLLRIQVEKP